jgi:hypothetical protein
MIGVGVHHTGATLDSSYFASVMGS